MMNLSKLFETQKLLDEHIEKEHPRKLGENRLEDKVLALLVESGECANEWRGFKFWSNDQEPRIRKMVYEEGIRDGGMIHYKNPLLEEYVDKLHFILSIGLEIDFDYEEYDSIFEQGRIIIDNTKIQYIKFNQAVTDFYDDPAEYTYIRIFEYFNGLGKMLRFTKEQIEEAYFAKNKINHDRQNNGY